MGPTASTSSPSPARMASPRAKGRRAPQIAKEFKNFNAAKAQCFKVEDRERLLAVIEAGFGDFKEFNDLVRTSSSRASRSRASGRRSSLGVGRARRRKGALHEAGGGRREAPRSCRLLEPTARGSAKKMTKPVSTSRRPAFPACLSAASSSPFGFFLPPRSLLAAASAGRRAQRAQQRRVDAELGEEAGAQPLLVRGARLAAVARGEAAAQPPQPPPPLGAVALPRAAGRLVAVAAVVADAAAAARRRLGREHAARREAVAPEQRAPCRPPRRRSGARATTRPAARGSACSCR